jgi:2-keto-4-pentenoate hydratase/2-oxohepta-3-ene-1,7-dioic acid hydratase in catechol pathway
MANYNILTFESEGRPKAGLLVDERVHDAAALTGEPTYESVLGILQDWDTAQGRLSDAAGRADQGKGASLSDVVLRAPILYPPTIYCAGANYKDHAEEMAHHTNRPVEPDPHTRGLKCFFFLKTGRAVADPDSTLDVTGLSAKLDWELELAAVIGRTAKRVSEEDALDYVAGYTVANDLSARDFLKRPHIADASPMKNDWQSCKNFDNSTPLGPWITTANQINDPHDLSMTLKVNHEVKQQSNSGSMIFNIREQIAHLSERITLYPGDVILTGTPAGVGVARNEFLKSGDVLTLTIDSIGTLTNRIA